MNIKLTGLMLGTALSALAFTACETAPTGTNANKAMMNGNGNVAVVVNSNHNSTTATTSTVSTTNTWNANMTRADYDKDRARYETEKGTSTIGTGANDSWLWFKTRAALTTTNDLRDSTINVDVNNDVITLRGTVATAEQKKKAEDVAKGIDGQKGIKNELKVAPADSMGNMSGNSTTTTTTNTNVKK